MESALLNICVMLTAPPFVLPSTPTSFARCRCQPKMAFTSATRGHAEAIADLTLLQRREIVDFEMTLFTASIDNRAAGRFNQQGARGGRECIESEPFYIGINDVLGADPTGRPVGPFDVCPVWA